MRRIVLIAATASLVLGGCKSKPKVEVKMCPCVPLLAQLTANPTAQKPVTKTDQGAATQFTYADQPSSGIRKLTVMTAKDRPGGWRAAFEAQDGATFAPLNFESKMDYGVGTNLPREWFELADGPLKGAIVHLPGEHCTKADAFSIPYFLSKAYNHEDSEMVRWACESGRAGIKAIAVSDFLHTCKDAVQAKLARPDTADFHYLGIEHEVLVSADCEYAWSSDVTAKNAFNAELKHRFKCSYSPKTGLVQSNIY